MTKTKCEECPLNGGVKVPWQNPLNPQWEVLFVGQNPGQTEIVTKVPFTGKAGKMTYRLMAGAGLDKRRIPITNVISCPTPDDREPTAQEINCCVLRLKDEIQRLKPRLIVALGKPALSVLLQDRLLGKKMEHLRGTFFDLSSFFDYECKVLSCYHPAFVMRQRQWIDVATDDFEKVKSFMLDETSITMKDNGFNPNHIIDPNPSKLAEFLERGRDEVVVFDVETTGLNPRQDKLLGVSYCYNALEAIGLDFTEGDIRYEVVEKFHSDPNVKKCAQNGSFDYAFFIPKGIVTNGLWWDTRLAETLIHPDMPKDLQAMRTLYTKIPPYKPSKREMKHVDEFSKEKRLVMSNLDVLTTYVVMKSQIPLMNEKEMFLKHDLLIPLIPIIHSMESKGVLVDVPTLAGLYAQRAPISRELEKLFYDELKILPSSPVQICKHFGLSDSKEETLKRLIRRGDSNAKWFEKILEFRQNEWVINSGLRSIYERLEDGRIHTSFLIEGAATGRLASRDPNLQNVPRWLRMIYIPDSDEYEWCDADMKQQELRVGALIAPEPRLLDELEHGKVVYHTLRQEIFGDRPEDESQFERQMTQTKEVVFGTLYGSTARSIGMKFGVAIYEAERWQSICINRFPGLLQYKKRCEKDILTKGYVETPFGRRRHVNSMTQGYNTPVQSTAADVSLYTLKRIHEHGFDLRLTVHDSFLIQIKKNDKDAIREFRKACELPFPQLNDYTFKVDIKVGNDWGENSLRKISDD